MLLRSIYGQKLAHIFAFAAASAIHGAATIWSLSPSQPLVMNQQAIQVSFVAPSNTNNKNENHSKKEIAPKVENLNALKTQKKQEAEKTAAKKETSGRVDPNAVANKAAESEPVFDAAYLNNPAPFYPSAAKRKSIQGKVLVDVVVKTDGTPAQVQIARSSGYGDLDEAALDAIKQWRFIPAKSKGQAIQANVIVPIEFKII
jgi:TonB family protein